MVKPSLMSFLSKEQIQAYEEQGFLMVPDFLGASEIARLRAKAAQIVTDFDMEAVSVFSTVEQTKTADTYFIDSGDKIRCFFEEDAFDETGQLQRGKEVSINKIGHALHDLDNDFEALSYKPEISDMATALGISDPVIVQSQYIFKQPRIGGKVVAHQDSTFIYTDPPSCVGFWMALEDATLENGCLMAIPGSHHPSLGNRRFIRSADGHSTQFIGEETQWDLSEMVQLDAKSGSLVLLHGACVHMSLENHSANTRHAYILHVVDGQATWSPENWLQRPDHFPFRHLKEVVDA